MTSIDPPTRTTRHKNDSFLDSDDARPLRIFAEYFEPMHDFHRERVCDTIVSVSSARLALTVRWATTTTPRVSA